MKSISKLSYVIVLLPLLQVDVLAKEPSKSRQSNITLPIISSTLPTSESFGGTVSLDALQHDFDVFSWQSFIALNWPANADGSPNNSIEIGTEDANTVWQHYKESRDIFLPNGAKPLGWDQTTSPPSECLGNKKHAVLSQVGKTPNVLDESGQPFQTGPLIDQNGLYTRFEILTNEVMFDYIVDNELYSEEGQATFNADANFPFSSSSKVGSIMLKAAWKVIGTNDDASKFHTSKAYVYNNPDEQKGVEAACSLQKVGLVGFHIGTKVSGNPQWIWSTFEHVYNVPTQGESLKRDHYNYFNTEQKQCQANSKDCTPVNTPPPRPWDPATPHTTPSQIERVIAIDKATMALNAQYQAALKNIKADSVWANYELVSTQWPTNANSKTDPTGIPAPMFLANTTLESYIQGEVKQTSSSCIQCHNNATMTNGLFADFTYLLQRAQPTKKTK
ncbi:hypothetical protein [Thalassotalea sp. PLHSN55]|uniref:hypothetical protein n=1 Tax=Thalassotalea sp. PLHSN55 TaxID=3435888 RepID=UPI003F87AA18